MNRGLLKVGQVHRDLREATDEKAGAFDEAQASTGKAHGLGDFFRDVDVGRIQKDVVGNERLTRANNCCTRRWMDAAFTEIGLARGMGGNLGADAFELAAAYVLQILANIRRGQAAAS